MLRLRNQSLIGLVALVLVGCGGAASTRPELATVKGTLLLDGKPVPHAMIEFAPESGGVSTGQSAADGTFTLAYRDGTPGAAIGKHRVTVTAGGPTPEQQAALNASAEGDRSVTIPTDIAPFVTYSDEATINAGENDVTLNVKKVAPVRTPRNSAER